MSSIDYYGNASLSNATTFQFTTSSNDSGSVRIDTPIALAYISQFHFIVPASNIPFKYNVHYGDDQSNLTLQFLNSNLSVSTGVHSLYNSNLQILYNTSNFVQLNLLDNVLKVRLNNTNVLKVENSNYPSGFSSNSFITIAGSNQTPNSNIFNHKITNFAMRATSQFGNDAYFRNSIKTSNVICKTVSTSNVSSCNILALSNVSYNLSNYVYTTNTNNISNAQTTANFGSNATSNTASLSNYTYQTLTPMVTTIQTTANWSSNNSSNLFLKIGGQITGDLGINGSLSYSQSTSKTQRLNTGIVRRSFTHSSGHPTNTAGMDAFINGATLNNINVVETPFSGQNAGDFFAYEWIGYINIPNDGNYDFGVNSDDASDAFIDGKLVAWWYGGHGNNGGNIPGGTQTTMYLTKGLHRIKVRFEEGNGGDYFEFLYRVNGSGTGYSQPTSSMYFYTADDFIVANSSGNIGIGLINPSSRLDVNGTVNATAYTGTTITNLSNLAMFGSNQSSNITSLSNFAYLTNTSNTSNITATQTTASWASNNLLNKNTGGTLSNSLDISGGGGIMLFATNPNMGSNGNASISVGKAKSTNNVANIRYTHVADSNTNNYVGIGFWGNDDIFNVRATGNVGIGTTTPSTKLDVNGTVNASAFTGSTITTLTNNITTAQTTASWSSNNSSNLFLKAGGTISGDITVSGLISTNRTGEARYRMYNNGSVAEWKMGQKTSSSHNFIISKVVSGTESDYLTVDTSGNLSVSGNVGIGTTSPATKLDVVGATLIRNGNGFNGWTQNQLVFGFSGTNTYCHTINTRHQATGGKTNSIDFLLWDNNVSSTTYGNKNAMSVTATGVGIFNSNPEIELDVVGNIKASGYVRCDYIYSSNIVANTEIATTSLGVGPLMSVYPGYVGTFDGDVKITGDIDCDNEVFCQTLGVNQTLTVKGASNNDGVFTTFPSTVDGNNLITGNTNIAVGSGAVCSVGGLRPTSTDSRLFVYNGCTVQDFVRFGEGFEVCRRLFTISVSVGSSGTATKNVSVSISPSVPFNNYRAFVSYESGTDSDTFVGKVKDKTTSSFTLITRRVDSASGWGDTVLAYVLIYSP
jgi:hypothetical protein